MSVHWFWIVGWFVTIFGFVGNTWVIFIIAKRRKLQTNANWFILSLAVADLSVTCGYFPASFVCNLLLKNVCDNDVRFNFLSSFSEASMFALMAMITERYIAIVYSLNYVSFMTSKRIFALIAASWGTPAFLFAARWIYGLYYSKLSAGEERAFIIAYTLLFEISPTMILIVSTLHIIYIARKISLQMSTLLIQVRFNQPTNTVTIKVPKTGLKMSTVRIVVAVVAIFVTCYGTEIYITFCETFELCEVTVGTKTAFSLLLMANSVLNPVVYAFLKQDIQRETKSLFRRRGKKRIKPCCVSQTGHV